MNKKTAEQIARHNDKIKEICNKRIQYLEGWIHEYRNPDYGARYYTKLEEYRKEVLELKAILDGHHEDDLRRENYELRKRNQDLAWLLGRCKEKMIGYGEFEVILRQISNYL